MTTEALSTSIPGCFTGIDHHDDSTGRPIGESAISPFDTVPNRDARSRAQTVMR
jgi:hypothetical protein